MSCIVIAKLIPDLDSLCFAELNDLLKVVADGVSRFEEGSLEFTNAGRILTDFIKLKLKK
jgi:hypothetical protein